MDQAIEVFELGLAKEAVPLKRLRRSYDQFKARLQERQRRGLLHKQQMEAKRQMESLKSTGQRTMLGQKFDSQSRVSVPANVHANIEARFGGDAGVGALGSASTALPSRSFGNSASSRTGSTMPSPSESFSVFTESTSTQPSSSLPAPRSSIAPAARSSLPSSASRPLHSSTTSAAFRRENQRATEKFAGATIRQSSLPTPPATVEKFQVYQDPPDSSAAASEHTALERAASSSSMLSVSAGDGSESTHSKQRRFPALDPTQKKKRRKDRDAQQQKTSVVPEFLEARFMQRRHLYFQSKDTKGGVEYIPIPQHHDHNQSFEELRATASKGYHRQQEKGKGRAAGQSQLDETDGKAAVTCQLLLLASRLTIVSM